MPFSFGKGESESWSIALMAVKIFVVAVVIHKDADVVLRSGWFCGS